MDICVKTSFGKNVELFKKSNNIKEGCWIRLISPDDELIKKISADFNIDSEIIHDMIDSESVPNIENETDEGYISIILRVPHKVEGEMITIPFGILFLKKQKIILTVCKFDDAVSKKLFNSSPIKFRTDKKSIFFSNFLSILINEYMCQLKVIGREINLVEKSIETALQNKKLVELLSLQKTLVYFKTAMVGNKKVISKISLGRVFLINEENKDLLEDIIIDIDEASELISIYSQIIKNTTDTYSSIVSNNLNSIMKVLALITVAISIPTMVGSFYGMNISLPFQSEGQAFFIIVLFSVTITVLSILVFRLKKWI
ncbi:MAG: magnesium transporter CorA family protein [Candidatus ainarchaeum sp.]|nr:magnesium transporter CorA family protein [Candidatus ainarchaeum sp.]